MGLRFEIVKKTRFLLGAISLWLSAGGTSRSYFARMKKNCIQLTDSSPVRFTPVINRYECYHPQSQPSHSIDKRTVLHAMHNEP